jgi:hypothetical protein
LLEISSMNIMYIIDSAVTSWLNLDRGGCSLEFAAILKYEPLQMDLWYSVLAIMCGKL